MKPDSKPKVEMQPIKGSSNIKSVGYDKEAKDLHIQFHNGGHFAYHNVAPHLFAGFMAAKSKGSYFHANIKKQHKFTKHADSVVNQASK